MATAVKIVKLDSDDNPTGDAIEFEEYETAAETQIKPRLRTNEQASQQGDRTLFVLGEEYNDILIRVRIYGTATETKLNTIRNYSKGGGIFRVYPKYIGDDTLSYDCYIDPSSILTKSIFAGRSMGGTVVELLFRETGMTSETVVEEEIVIE